VTTTFAVPRPLDRVRTDSNRFSFLWVGRKAHAKLWTITRLPEKGHFSGFAEYALQGKISQAKFHLTEGSPTRRHMTRDDIQLLYEYDRWANNRVLQAVCVLSTEQFTHDLGGSFRSVRDTLVHIIGGEWIWLEYWKDPSPSSASLTDLRKRRDALFNPTAFPNVAAVQLKWAEVEKKQAEFVNGMTNESLERMLPFRTTQIRLAHLMQHLANHSTYHRGQVALIMRQLDAEPVATDFHVFLVEGSREVATAH
jgi:uncharacterized damage-inducible protein DinB